jgi:hypothetical protein
VKTAAPLKDRICCRCQAFYAGRVGDRWCPRCKPWEDWLHDPSTTVEELQDTRALLDWLIAKVESGTPLAVAIDKVDVRVFEESGARPADPDRIDDVMERLIRREAERNGSSL